MINCKKLIFYNRFTVDFTVVGEQIGCPYFTVIFLQCMFVCLCVLFKGSYNGGGDHYDYTTFGVYDNAIAIGLDLHRGTSHTMEVPEWGYNGTYSTENYAHQAQKLIRNHQPEKASKKSGRGHFFGGCVPRGFQNVGSRERIFLENGGLGNENFWRRVKRMRFTKSTFGV